MERASAAKIKTMLITSAPKSLKDLEFMSNVIYLDRGDSMEVAAPRIFEKVLDTREAITCILIFQESEAESDEEVLRAEIKQVWQCFAGECPDCLYLVSETIQTGISQS
jgi:hypothetical protein